MSLNLEFRKLSPVVISSMPNENFLLLRPYHGEHGPKVPVTPELHCFAQRVLRKRECMSILTMRQICILFQMVGLSLKANFRNNL
jgi:hypothetical protein